MKRHLPFWFTAIVFTLISAGITFAQSSPFQFDADGNEKPSNNKTIISKIAVPPLAYTPKISSVACGRRRSSGSMCAVAGQLRAREPLHRPPRPGTQTGRHSQTVRPWEQRSVRVRGACCMRRRGPTRRCVSTASFTLADSRRIGCRSPPPSIRTDRSSPRSICAPAMLS